MDTLRKRYSFLALAVLGGLLLLIPALGAGATPPPPAPDALPDTLALAPSSPSSLPLPLSLSLSLPLPPLPLPSPVWRIGVMTDGIYTLDYATLAAAGVPVTGAALADVRLFWRGQEVALEEAIVGAFGPDDALYFYGEKFHGARQDEDYTDENVYWLTVDASTPGLRMATRDVTPSGAPAGVCRVTVVAEQNLRYWARASTNPGTLTTWFWEYTNTAKTVTSTYPIVLPAPLTTGEAATLVVELASFNYNNLVNPDHHVRLIFNGTALGDFYWDGKIGHVITTTVPAAALLTGNNTLWVAYVTDVGHQSVYFDRATLTYRQSPVADGGTFVCAALTDAAATYTVAGLPAGARLYDVSDPLRPVALVNGGAAFADTAPVGTRYRGEVPRPVTLTRYTPDADLLAPSTGADEIIIAPRQFFAALQPLVTQREAQGLRVRLVDVDDIYPLFNGGVFHPEAIRAFVAYAYANWPGPAVRYLFLVGDGNFNFKGHNPANYGEFTPTLIPPYREFADPTQGDVPVDSRFGDVNGDGLPEVFVGRIPAQTTTEVAAYVAKVLAYEAQPPADWQLHALLVADNGEKSDEGFDRLLNRLQALFPAALTTQTVYMKDYCPPVVGTPCPAATAALTQAWNAGAGLLAYAGHGSINRWAHEPLIFNRDLTALTQTTGLPFLLSLDCWDGYWMFPPKYPGISDVRSIGEWVTTVLTQTGAIAAYGPAGLAYASSEETLARAMFTAAFQRGVFNLGELSHIGREAIRTSYEARTYTLFGDPALSLPWWLRLRITPGALTAQAGSAVELAQFLVSQGDTRFGQTFAVTPTWTADVGTVDAYGVYTAPTTAGTVQLTGHLGPLSATVTLVVAESPPVSVSVTPNPLLIGVGKSAQMTATPYDAFDNPVAVTATVLWSSDVGVIDASGLFTAPMTPATGWITATLPISDGTNTILLTGTARVEVIEMTHIYLPLVLRQIRATSDADSH